MTDKYELRFDPIHTDYLYLHSMTRSKLGTFYHRHEAYELYLFLRGNVNLYIENSCYHLERGDLVVIRPEEMHRASTLDSSEYERMILNLQRPYIQKLSTSTTHLAECFDYRPKGKGNIVRLNEDQLSRFLHMANQLEAALNSKSYGSDVLVNSYIAQILVFTNSVFREYNSSHHNIMPDIVRRTMEYIDSHLRDEITLDRLGKEFYVNSTTLSRQFKKHTGLTLRSYILHRRIALAQSCLSQGYSVTEACYESGFKDYANFIRSFTRITGISPGKYARKHRHSNDT